MTGVSGASAPALPLLPGITVCYHWDHHWFGWTPGHPLYESFEVMSVDAPAAPGGALVWAFFTRRTPPRRQVHFLNDERLARAWRGEAYARDIVYQATGAIGSPRRLELEMVDAEGRELRWTCEPEGDDFPRGGLTDQQGHEEDRFLLLFLRGRTQRTRRSRLLLAGEPIGAGEHDGSPFVAAYSFDVMVASLVFGELDVRAEAATVRRGERDRFEWRGSDRLDGTLAGFRQSATVTLDAAGNLREYAHHSLEHELRLAFAPAIPWTLERGFAPGFAGRFDVSLGTADGVIGGGVLTHDRNALRLAPERPAWAAARPLLWRTEVRPGGYATGFVAAGS